MCQDHPYLPKVLTLDDLQTKNRQTQSPKFNKRKKEVQRRFSHILLVPIGEKLTLMTLKC